RGRQDRAQGHDIAQGLAMIQRDVLDGGAAFQGDRALRLRSVPGGARIVRATATVTPVDATDGTDPFAETLAFQGAAGDFGTTKSAPAGWVEVDFHARRTLVRVEGHNLANCTLQVDLGGGAYVEINPAGAIRTPNDATGFTLTSDNAALPAL